MVEAGLKMSRKELAGRLQKLMFLRVLFVSLLLGASIVVQVRESRTYFGDIQTSHYLLIAAIYFLTFIYILLIKLFKDLVKLAYLQLMMDSLLVTAIIYATGGMDSIFSFLYILTIINAGMIVYRRGALILATASSLLYGVLLDLHYFGLINPFGSRTHFTVELQGGYIFYSILVNTVAFYLVAFLSSFLSEQAMKSRVELKAKQDDVIKLEALNERIIRSIASGLITLDGKGRIILFNPAAEEIFGMNAREAIGRNVEDLLPFLGDFLKENLEMKDPETGKKQPYRDYAYTAKDGKSRFIRFAISPLSLSERGQKGQILVFQDMTEMKQIEEEMKRVEGMALIGEMAAGIAHEIRNPMASISGSIQMLREGLSEDDVNKRLMDIVLREINRLNHLVSDFLLFARPKNPQVKEFDLNKLISESLELIKNSDKWVDRIKVKTYFGGGIILTSDSEQVRQVLLNLLLNACESMDAGGSLQIYTDWVEIDEGAHGIRKMAKVMIRDTGNGFSPQALTHLFTPFYTTKEGGSGLGLAIVKRVVGGLRGKVYGENHPQGGAVMTLYLHPDHSDVRKEPVQPRA